MNDVPRSAGSKNTVAAGVIQVLCISRVQVQRHVDKACIAGFSADFSSFGTRNWLSSFSRKAI